MKNRTGHVRPVVIVLGCGDVGSAVALALHCAGSSVVLIDEADPAWHRRGMAFTDAWYVGNAELAGEGACFCASLKSLPSVLARRMIAATTWSWPGVADVLAPSVLVDARGRKRPGSEILLGGVPLAIGIGANFAQGKNVDVAIELPAGSYYPLGENGDPRKHASDRGAARSANCVVESVRHGRFMTERRIGDVVRAGQIVGGLGNEAISAPAPGVLLGLPARGARVKPGDILVEVDTIGVSQGCHGVGEQLRHVAASVVSTIANRSPSPSVLAAATGPGIAHEIALRTMRPAAVGGALMTDFAPHRGDTTLVSAP